MESIMTALLVAFVGYLLALPAIQEWRWKRSRQQKALLDTNTTPTFEGITFNGVALPYQEGINLDNILEEANDLLEDVTELYMQVDDLHIRHCKLCRRAKRARNTGAHGARKSKAKK